MNNRSNIRPDEATHLDAKSVGFANIHMGLILTLIRNLAPSLKQLAHENAAQGQKAILYQVLAGSLIARNPYVVEADWSAWNLLEVPGYKVTEWEALGILLTLYDWLSMMGDGLFPPDSFQLTADELAKIGGEIEAELFRVFPDLNLVSATIH